MTSLCVRTFGHLRGAAPCSPNPAIAERHSRYICECRSPMSAAAVFVAEECRCPKVLRRASSSHRWWMSCKGATIMAHSFRVRPHMISDDDGTRFGHSRAHTTDLPQSGVSKRFTECDAGGDCRASIFRCRSSGSSAIIILWRPAAAGHII